MWRLASARRTIRAAHSGIRAVRHAKYRTLAQPDAREVELSRQLADNRARFEARVVLDEGICPGCGIPLQSHAPGGWGYHPQAALEPGDLPDEHTQSSSDESDETEPAALLCQRCHRLRHHNDQNVRLMTSRQARRELEKALDNRRCIVVNIVDLLDFNGSFIPELHTMIGKRRPVIVAGMSKHFVHCKQSLLLSMAESVGNL